MDKEAATQYVIRELAKNRSKSDIIMRLCEVDGISWNEADAFIAGVESEHHKKISAGQAPLLIIVGLIVVISGFYIVIRYGLVTLDGVNIPFWFLPVPYLGNIMRIGTGLAMIAGGGFGVLKALWNILK